MDNFTLGANLAYLHARYTDFCADTNGVFTNGAPEPGQCGPAVPILINGVPNGTFAVPTDSTGLELANAPEWSGRVSADRSEEHTSELQSLMRNTYAVFCLKNKNKAVRDINH